MYIQHDSTVWLLEGVPLDPAYVNTVKWQSAASQKAWFTSHANHIVDKVSYQRHDEPVLRLELEQADVFNCNYMAFTNTAFSDKMFYAFITDVSYTSNNVCEIHFELDVMQTFMFDWTLEQCWVEREHSATDRIGEHTLAEPIDFGDYVVTTSKYVNEFNSWGVMVNTVYTDS